MRGAGVVVGTLDKVEVVGGRVVAAVELTTVLGVTVVVVAAVVLAKVVKGADVPLKQGPGRGLELLTN